MSVDVNFHIHDGETLTTRVVSFPSHVDPFVTFELSSNGDSVTVYVRKLEDAKRVFEAAKDLVRQVSDLEVAKILETNISDL